MINEIIKILKGVAIAGLVVTALGALGQAINSLIDWDYLTISFAIARAWIMKANFIWDIPNLLMLVGYAFIIAVAYLSWLALKWAISFFK